MPKIILVVSLRVCSSLSDVLSYKVKYFNLRTGVPRYLRTVFKATQLKSLLSYLTLPYFTVTAPSAETIPEANLGT